jgi:hypothetical protein
MNAGCGDIQLFSEQSREGSALMGEMNNSENVMKKQMVNKWKQYMYEDDG